MTLARLTQVSFWGPETLRGNGASARAKHQQATAEKVSAVTTERNNMLKTLKRKIALGAVAAVGAAGLVTIAAPAANANVTAISASVYPTRTSASATSVTAAITATFDASAGNETKTVKMRITSIPSTVSDSASAATSKVAVGSILDCGTVDMSTGAGSAIVACAETGTALVYSGTYTAIMWWNSAVNDNNIDALEPYTSVSFNVGGAPASVAVTTTTPSVAGTTAATYNVTVKDALGNVTALRTGENVNVVTTISTPTTVSGESISVTRRSGTATVAGVGNNPKGSVIDSTDTTTASTGAYSLSVKATGVVPVSGTLAFSLGGSLNPSTPVSAAFTATAASKLSSIKLANTAGVTAVSASGTGPNAAGTKKYYVAPTALTSDTTTYTATGTAGYQASATLAPVLNYTLAGTASSTVNLRVTNAGVASTVPVVLDATGAGSYSVTPTSTTSGTAVVVAADIATCTGCDAATATLTTTYAASAITAAAVGLNGATFTPDLSTVTSAINTVGADTSIKMVLKDQFGTPQPFYTLRGTLSSTSRNYGITIADALTDATGTATITYKDASTSTTNLSDVLTIQAYAPATAAVVFQTTLPTLTTTFSSTGKFASLALAGGTSSTATVTQSLPTADGTTNAITLTPSLLNSLGNAVSGVALVYTGSAGVKFRNGTSTIATDVATTTVGSGNTVTAYGTVPGTATVTVTGGGLTATASWTVKSAVRAKAVGITAVGNKVTATVKDGFGNPVAGVTVNLATTSAGVFGAGVTSTSAVTDATGAASAVVNSADGKAGSVTVSATIGSVPGTVTDETADLADARIVGHSAGVATASATVAVPASAAASGDAATAAAQKATDAKIADIATAVTNLSTTVAGLVASLVAQIKDTKAAITDTQAALAALAAVVKKIQVKVKA